MQNSFSKAVKSLNHGFFKLYPAEAARLLNTFSNEEILTYLYDEPIAQASEIYSLLNPEIASRKK